MDVKHAIDTLARGARAVEVLISEMSEEQARWKPTEKDWSVLEVVNHLADEEVLDFRMRLELLLDSPDVAWPPIDPATWVRDRGYNERDLLMSLERFLGVRRQSIRWLENLGSADWENCCEHPSLGQIKAGDLLTAWVTHDLKHVEQLSRLHKDYLVQEKSDYSAKYAG
jgi:hypothetical protein